MIEQIDPLRELRARFKYKADARDKWSLLDGENFAGDCEDFSLTALWLLAGRSWPRLWWMVLTFQAVFWHARLSNGGGHVMLWVRGHGWIDNIYPTWSPVPRIQRLFPIIAPGLALSLILKR
jgi:predicted transglutaminase-like cysteine proteinase